VKFNYHRNLHSATSFPNNMNVEHDGAAITQRRPNTDLPVATRVAILFTLHNLAKDDKLPRGAYTDVGNKYLYGQLVTNVQAAFDLLDAETLDNVFYSWMLCMEQIMLCGGGNDYNIPHIGKKRLRRLGLLPRVLPCSVDAVLAARATLDAAGLI